MNNTYLEHANLTVTNPNATAAVLIDIFDWKVRWSGESMDQGYTVHVGNDDQYLALYTSPEIRHDNDNDHKNILNLNHLGVIVDDINQVEAKVIALGLTPHSHADYEPGKRFYFDTEDNLEIEVVSYDEV